MCAEKLDQIPDDPNFPPKLQHLLSLRDGAPLVAKELASEFPPTVVASAAPKIRAWEVAGLYYLSGHRYHEALIVFSKLYDHLLAASEESGAWRSKGMPLVWMSECYQHLGFASIARRFLLLTLIEDAIGGKGSIRPEETGSYFRLVWLGGLSDAEVQRYATEAYVWYEQNPTNGRYPEWVLQQLDDNWIAQAPSNQEVGVFVSNARYVKHLMNQLGDGTGNALELLASYLLSSMPGCRTTRRSRTPSTDYDIVCSVDGLELDFRSEFGRYFVCECKDWHSPADFSTMAKFCRVLDSVKSRFGILFSKEGMTGADRLKHAEREQLKVFQDRGIVIVVVDKSDIQRVSDGANFINILRSKYEKVRLDLIGN